MNASDETKPLPAYQDPILDVEDLTKRKRWKDALAIVILFFTIVFLYFLPSILVLIGPGEAGVKFKRFAGGTVTDYIYSEGFHLIYPWDKMHVYNVRFQSTNVNFTILAESGLTLRIDLTIRYRPIYDLLGVLHQKVGPNYVETVIIPEIKSAIRTTVGSYSAEEIYTTQRAILENVVDTSIEEASQRFIQVDDVIIERIVLPDTIQAAIEAKLTEKEILGSYIYRIQTEEKERFRKVIEATGDAEANRLLADTLNPTILSWRGIEATRQIATSTNSKVVIVGTGAKEMPVILSNP